MKRKTRLKRSKIMNQVTSQVKLHQLPSHQSPRKAINLGRQKAKMNPALMLMKFSIKVKGI